MADGNPLRVGYGQRGRTVYDYFNQALRSPRDPDLPVQGELISGNDGLSAQFFAEVQGDRLTRVSYRCATCVTLVAYCELLAETLAGLSPAEVMLVKTSDLIDALPGVPSFRYDRAGLALGALQSAVGRAEMPRG